MTFDEGICFSGTVQKQGFLRARHEKLAPLRFFVLVGR
jgi:hypothetical protein